MKIDKEQCSLHSHFKKSRGETKIDRSVAEMGDQRGHLTFRKRGQSGQDGIEGFGFQKKSFDFVCKMEEMQPKNLEFFAKE